MKQILPVLALLLTVTACGKSAGLPMEPEVATGNEPTEFQKSKMIGHYSTLDGATGFVMWLTWRSSIASSTAREIRSSCAWMAPR